MTEVAEQEQADTPVEAQFETVQPVDASEAPPQPDAVFVLKRTDDQGNISTEVGQQGDVRATEVETLLKLGLAKWQSQLGL